MANLYTYMYENIKNCGNECCKEYYDLLEAIIIQLNDSRTQFNQLRADYNAETQADHTDTSATDVTQLVTHLEE